MFREWEEWEAAILRPNLTSSLRSFSSIPSIFHSSLWCHSSSSLPNVHLYFNVSPRGRENSFMNKSAAGDWVCFPSEDSVPPGLQAASSSQPSQHPEQINKVLQRTLLYHQQNSTCGFHKEWIKVLISSLSFVLPAHHRHCRETDHDRLKGPNPNFLGLLKMSNVSLFLIRQVPEENQNRITQWNFWGLTIHNLELKLLSVLFVPGLKKTFSLQIKLWNGSIDLIHK